MAEALIGRAVQATIRGIQKEAELIRASGVAFPSAEDEPEDAKDRKMWLLQRMVARQSDNAGERLDYIAQVKSNGEIILYSAKLAAFGRTSEGAAHVRCIPAMAAADLTVLPDAFDTEPLKVNVANGTLTLLRPENGFAASVAFGPHRREDMMTKIAAAAYEPVALCPRYDAFLEQVQPQAEMREFLDVWAGYNMLGDASAQKMALFYGQGSNGKGVWINTKAHILGDYAWAAAIETFIDQGRYRRGSEASPDMAALAGRRMVFANEPEEGSKFSDGLIKSMTSDEPIGGVRELMKSPFQLLVTFKNTVSANNKPRIGTDHGIQRRMQIVPWDVIIPQAEQDPTLKAKLKEEVSGILNRMVRGAIHFLDKGLPSPEAIEKATKAYLEENDVLGQFIGLCIEKRTGSTLGSTELYDLFKAWQTWAGQLDKNGKAWSQKFLTGQMTKKGFVVAKSSTMRWHDIVAKFAAHDFIDSDGRPRANLDVGDDPAPPPVDGAPAPPVRDIFEEDGEMP
jgi:putative DNA primase/helicase